MKRRSLHGLGKLQQEVLDHVWNAGEATVADVVGHISRTRPIGYTSVLVAMQKLEKKGWLRHRSRGRAYVYRPARSRDEAGGGLLCDVLHTAFGGNAQSLLVALLDEAPLDDQELAELNKVIQQRRKESRDA